MDDLLNVSAAPLSLTALAVNLLLGIVLGTLVAAFYTRYGRSLSNRARFAQTLPVLAAVTVLIISVVKSSLALSLGLVGALSIVRFRTAIKEPEELVYLFMAIAIGLGLGADQRWPTIVAISLILLFLLARTALSPRNSGSNLYFNVATKDHDQALKTINSLVADHSLDAELRRIDRSNGSLAATYLIPSSDVNALIAFMDGLRHQLPECELSFVEQDNSLSA
jgi:hypothetical protein